MNLTRLQETYQIVTTDNAIRNNIYIEKLVIIIINPFKKQVAMITLGKFKANFIPYFSALAAGISIIVIQIVAVKMGHEKPYPAATISMTAQHYPEFILFRLTTISNSTLFIMSWFMNYFLIHYKNQNIGKYFPGVSAFFGTLGSISLMFSTTLLDTGVYKNNLHVIGAVLFFLSTSIACIYNTIISYIIYKTTKNFGKYNLMIKIILTIIIIVWVYLGLFYKGPIKHFTQIMEYNLTFSLLAYFLIIGYDLRNYELNYELSEDGPSKVVVNNNYS